MKELHKRSRNPKYKPKYKVINRNRYESSVRNRGFLSFLRWEDVSPKWFFENGMVGRIHSGNCLCTPAATLSTIRFLSMFGIHLPPVILFLVSFRNRRTGRTKVHVSHFSGLRGTHFFRHLVFLKPEINVGNAHLAKGS